MRSLAAAVCLIAVLAAPAVAGDLSREDRLLVLGASEKELVARLDSAEPSVRRDLYRMMTEYPARWSPLLLERLDDRGWFPLLGVERGLEAGVLEPRATTARLEKHRESPHAFVRIRAANLLLAIDRERGIRWLEEELRIRRTWCHASYRNCDGSAGGLEGWIERLKSPPVDPYDTVGETVEVPAERFRVEVVPLPFRGRPAYRVLLRNVGPEPLLRLPNLRFSKTLHGRAGSGNLFSIGGGSVGGGHSRMVRRIEPGSIAFDATLEFAVEELAALERAELHFSFTMPDRRAGRTTASVPAALLPTIPDLEAYRRGMNHGDRAVRSEFLGMLASGRTAVSDAARRGVAEILLRALEAVPPREDPEPVFFWSSRTQTPEVERLVKSLTTVAEALVPADFDRLLRLRNSCAVRQLRALDADPRLADAIRRAAGLADPLLVQNLAILRLGSPHQMLTDAERLPIVARWLRSEDSIIRRAGLRTVYRGKLEPDGWEAAVSRSLVSEDPHVVRAAVFTASRRAKGVDRRLLDVFRTTKHPAVRIAVLEALATKLHGRIAEEDVRVLAEFVTPMLEVPPDPGEERKLVRTIVSRDDRLVSLPVLVEADERWGEDAFFPTLRRRGHDFGRPLLARIAGAPEFTRLLGAEPRVHGRLVLLEREREGNSELEAHYTKLLNEAIHAGNDAEAAPACLPLAWGKTAASLRALEVATGSDSDEVALCAAWCLALRDPGRPRPELEVEEEEDD